MYNFDNTINKILVEHCKIGDLFTPFNKLQKKIFEALYFNHLKDTKYDFEMPVKDINSLFLAILDEKIEIMEFIGDELCYHIPDEKVEDYDEEDVDKWAKITFNRVYKHEEL